MTLATLAGVGYYQAGQQQAGRLAAANLGRTLLSENLFADLFRWAHRQDEHFVTQAFAFLVSYLCKHDWEAARDFLRRLCFGEESDHSIKEQPTIRAQIREECGTPDIRISWANVLVLVEVKVKSGVRAPQLECYRGILKRSLAATQRLVLLALHPFEAEPGDERPDDHLYWFQVGSWLRRLPLRNAVSRFLMIQFVDFLEGKRMSVQRITNEYVSGIQMFNCLITMLDRAIRDVTPRIPFCQSTPSGGTKCRRFLLGKKGDKPSYTVGIYFKELEVIRFRFANAPFAAAQINHLSGWKMYKGKPACDYALDGDSYRLDSEEQKHKLTEFVSRAYREAAQLSQSKNAS